MPEPSPSPPEIGPGRWLGPMGVAMILWGSYAYVWQARDWNSASRLMLTYAIVDRGTIRLDGYRTQTEDIAEVDGHFYTDKQPGYSLAATLPYAAAKAALGLPDHPRGGPALRRWPGDYWATLGTAGLATAIAGAVLAAIARRFGCGPRTSALVGLSYGLATPAFAYATMSYGHQLASACLLGAFAVIELPDTRRPLLSMAAAGALAAWGSVVELSLGPVSAILALFAVVKVIRGEVSFRGLSAFAIGAMGPTLILGIYNTIAFGNPLDIGYAHHANPLFAPIHSEENPTGLTGPRWDRVAPLLWGRYRGLAFYAPIVLLAVPGWIALLFKGRAAASLASLLAASAVLLVNLSYPEWTGGWSTGPRLLVPLLPFAMVGVAGAFASGGRAALVLGGPLAVGGAALMLMFVGVGAQMPQWWADPLTEVAWPHWSGGRLATGWVGERFTKTLPAIVAPGWVEGLGASRGWLQFAPLLAGQGAAIVALMALLGRVSRGTRPR